MALPSSKPSASASSSAWTVASRVGIVVLLALCLTLIWFTVSGLTLQALPSGDVEAFASTKEEGLATNGVNVAQAEGAAGPAGADASASGEGAAATAGEASSGDTRATLATGTEGTQEGASVQQPAAGVQGGAEEVAAAQGDANDKDHLQRQENFNRIYSQNMWGSAQSRSGIGSEAGYTANIRRFMSVVFKAYGIKSLLDSPCGDCNWQPLIPGFNDTDYTGIDIVSSVIEGNKEKFKDRPKMRFFTVDVVSEPVPPGEYDAVLCRDMIQHLPLKTGVEAYRMLEKSGAKYLLTSFHSGARPELIQDILPGAFHLTDPMLPPYNFSKPIMYALEGIDSFKDNYKMIGLWKLPTVGLGSGESINPINPKAKQKSVVACNSEAVEKLKSVGYEDYICHSPEACGGEGATTQEGASEPQPAAGVQGSAEEVAAAQGDANDKDHLQRKANFDRIYSQNMWGSAQSRSGIGSEAGYTANIRRFMSVVFKAYGIKSLLDSPCGDCNWQPLIPGFNDTDYTGIDIVSSVIEGNKEKFKDRPKMRFFTVDVVSEPVPPGEYDAVLCRDMIQHLPLQTGVEAYRTLEKSGAKYLLTSFHSGARPELIRDISPGDFHLTDPMLPPYNFSKPIMYALEGIDTFKDNYKMIGLWKLPTVGLGNGESINPINPEAKQKSVVACNSEGVEKLKSVGYEDYICHSPEACARR